jgi:hypothetical protein
MTNQNQPGSFGDQAKSMAGEVRNKANGLASATADTVKDRGADFMEAAKDVAGDATDKINDAVAQKKHAGAEYIGRVAETIRRAGREVEKEMPFIGPYVTQAASQIDKVGNSVRNGELNDVVSGVQDFARRQPVAFLGIATLAGFAAVRFVKSAPADGLKSSSRGTSNFATAASNYAAAEKGYRDDFSK